MHGTGLRITKRYKCFSANTCVKVRKRIVKTNTDISFWYQKITNNDVTSHKILKVSTCILKQSQPFTDINSHVKEIIIEF